MIRKKIIVILLYGFIAVLAIVGSNTIPTAKKSTFTVHKGQYGNGVIRHLKNKDIISDALSFRLLQILTFSNVKAGTYTTQKGDTQAHIMFKMMNHSVELHTLTIPEGMSTQQMLEIVNNTPELSGEITTKSPVLWLPETYQFENGYSKNDLIAEMQKSFYEVAMPLWESRQKNLPFDTLLQATSLAAVVEKETGVAHERPLVASVFVNRLRKNMRLQSDPTVIYALTNGYGKMHRPLTRADWKFQHPYNTYRVRGIPPKPIAGVGKEALKAVLNPPETDYIYFMATGTGGHNFAQTLRQHNNNIIAFKKRRRNKK